MTCERFVCAVFKGFHLLSEQEPEAKNRQHINFRTAKRTSCLTCVTGMAQRVDGEFSGH